MRKILIDGPSNLSGKVKVQGAKNSAMKHVFVPLMSDETFTLTNIPAIGSITKHLELISFLGADIEWKNLNTVQINTKKITQNIIPKEYLYYTSDGNKIIPILTSKFGSCTIEVDPDRLDRGGDQIGSRSFDDILKTLKECGIESSNGGNSQIIFTAKSFDPFKFIVPHGSFSASVLTLFAALYKNGKSTIINYTTTSEFNDILELLIQSGAKIKKLENTLFVWGPTKLTGTTYKNMYDQHDLVTWISAALSTNSKIQIEGIEFDKMRLEMLEKLFATMNIQVNLRSSITEIQPQLDKIKPTNIIAGQFPLLTTEWQVLLSPLFTQIQGQSSIVETFFSNRMQHWHELKKMGVNFKFYKDPRYPEIESKPRAVKVTGRQKLYGAKVNALDVRCGAALVIAGLIAQGKTEITNIEHLERGYENLVERLQVLDANIKYIK